MRLNYTGYRLFDSTGPLVVTEMLVIRNVSSRDEGMYSCVGGAGKRYDATLTVVCKGLRFNNSMLFIILRQRSCFNDASNMQYMQHHRLYPKVA